MNYLKIFLIIGISLALFNCSDDDPSQSTENNIVITDSSGNALSNLEVVYLYDFIEINVDIPTLPITPNPVANTFNLNCFIEEASYVKLILQDLTTNEEKTFFDGVFAPGLHSYQHDLSSSFDEEHGFYQAKIKINDVTRDSTLIIKPNSNLIDNMLGFPAYFIFAFAKYTTDNTGKIEINNFKNILKGYKFQSTYHTGTVYGSYVLNGNIRLAIMQNDTIYKEVVIKPEDLKSQIKLKI